MSQKSTPLAVLFIQRAEMKSERKSVSRMANAMITLTNCWLLSSARYPGGYRLRSMTVEAKA